MKLNSVVIILSALAVTMFFMVSILNSFDKIICNNNFCAAQSNVMSKDLYVNAAPEGNYTSNTSEEREDEDESDDENDNPPEALPSVNAPYTPSGEEENNEENEAKDLPYIPPNNKDEDNDDNNKGKHKSDRDDNSRTDDNSDYATSATLSGSNEAIKPSMTTVSNASNVTQTPTGGNPIVDALKSIFGGIMGSNP